MQGILLLLPEDGGPIPGARELREAGFTLSTALAPARGGSDRAAGDEAVHPCGGGADRSGKEVACGPPAGAGEDRPPAKTYDSPARRMTSRQTSDRLKG